VEYLVRAARVTDIDRLVALSDGTFGSSRDQGPLVAADLLRQLVYLPQASIVVAESQRAVVGGGVLALRPSVSSGGYVGTIDLLVIDPNHDQDRITEALVDELLRSASNKGCAVVETARPEDHAARARLEVMGFGVAGPRLQRTVAAAGSAGRRT
jgi:predicted N-acetyltransferase YhbS